MNLDTLNQGELFTEIAELARAEGVADQASWNMLVDQVLESHESMGEMNDDQDIQGQRQALHAMWSEYFRESGEESLRATSEDPDAPHE